MSKPKPRAKRALAACRTEAEEALWFEQNQDRLMDLFNKAAKEGALRIGNKTVGITIDRKSERVVKPVSKKVMLRIPIEDLERARKLASERGLGYQTYMKMLLRQGLNSESRKAS